MRRMTISRSELTTLAALFALATPALAAQQAPNIQRPIEAARGAAAQTNANIQAQQAPSSDQPASTPGERVQLGTAPGQQGVQNPGTHIVQQGETLWQLAGTYLGDPMLWPEIYRLNTNVVEDPHWIYPGEELRLSALSAPTDTVVAQGLTVTPGADTARPAPVVITPVGGPTIFSSPSARVRGGASVEVISSRAYRAVREGEYFSSGFLTENQPLNTGRIASTSAELRDVTRTRTTAHLFETITMTAPAGEAIAPGDLMLAFRRTEDHVGDYGQVVVPTGLVRVRGAAGVGNNMLSGTVVSIYGPMENDQELLKVQPFVNNSNMRAVPVGNGLEGRVLRMRENRNVAQQLDVIFIDKGANEGLRLGDIIQVYVQRADEEHGGTVERDQARAIIVSTRSRTATAVIVELYRGDVGSQSLIRLVRRMPS
jgi:hypothetical protein